MKRVIGNLVLGIIALLIINSCQKPKVFSEIPKITFKEFRQFKTISGQDTSLDIVFSFEDGDGDLGYLENEFIRCNVPLNNLFMYYEVKQAGAFAPLNYFDHWLEFNDNCDTIVNDAFRQLHFESRMTYIQPTGSSKSIEGEVSYHLSNTFIPFLFPNDSVQTAIGRLRFYIVDRAGHKSNEVISNDLNLSR